VKRKYQVFISSTFSDLAEHRRQAVLAIVKAGHFPLALEYHGLEASTKSDTIRTAIAECQFYVLILGHRYGTVASGQPPGQEKSYVEHELDYATTKGLRVLTLVLNRNKAQQLRNELKLPDDKDERLNEDKYWLLYERLTSSLDGPYYYPFDTPFEVYTELYAFFSREHVDVKGYIPEPLAQEDTNILRISGSNEILRETIQHLGQFQFVDPRLNVEKEKKLALARAFRQLHGDHVRDKWDKVFIESGSTLAYLAKGLVESLPKMGSNAVKKVITNNSLAYLYLWLCSSVLCHPEPEGPPDNKYGGMFGPLMGRDRVPDYELTPLAVYDPEAVGIIKRLSRSIFGDTRDNAHAVLLAAASGIQLSDEVTAYDGDTQQPVRDERTLDRLRRCKGFHGGSYKNRLFKLCMFLTRIPAFVFMHDSKVDCAIRVGLCHFLCDEGNRWEDYIGAYPLALWVACEPLTLHTTKDKLTKYLRPGDWTSAVYGDATSTPIVMSYNAAFRDASKRAGVTLYETRRGAGPELEPTMSRTP
jgi:hypothetical protein